MVVSATVNECRDHHMMGFDMWTIILGWVAHVLLVINSAANLFIYYGVGVKFREVFIIYLRKLVACVIPSQQYR